MTYLTQKTMEAEALVAEARTDQAREAAQRIFEAFRESNPGTDRQLQMIEASIASTFAAFQHAVQTSNQEIIDLLEDRLLTLIKNRNRLFETEE
ncbi:MAG TPA: hypothetical protein PK646_02360 [Bacillota bacterium]|jgi:hypothetical protein|nr:hypothetical protein [Fastidiosipila sp.]HPX93257.1 hypothetical protein [Bacillota bacterium]HQB80916.1 hypothetical protein [Bacillota bacterium]